MHVTKFERIGCTQGRKNKSLSDAYSTLISCLQRHCSINCDFANFEGIENWTVYFIPFIKGVVQLKYCDINKSKHFR